MHALIIGIGFALTAYSMYQMTLFSLQMDSHLVVVSGVGVGFVYAPLASVTFATLSLVFRNEVTALFSLLQNLGSSIGLSMIELLLTRSTQTVHSTLGSNLSKLNPAVRQMFPDGVLDSRVLAQLNLSLTRQSAMIAYIDDFKLMMILCIAALPLVFVSRKAKSGSGTKAEPVTTE